MSNSQMAFYLLVMTGLWSCHAGSKEETADTEAEVVTPVTITPISQEPMAEYIELNATSAYLQRAVVKASATGYITGVEIKTGQIVKAGQRAFVEKTKEAASIGNTINLLDSTFKFSGIISVKTLTGGYVSEVNHAIGDFVQEGEQLAIIGDSRSFVFILNLPYELRPYILNKNTVDLVLPDGKKLNGRIKSVLPVVDSAAQTQSVMLSVKETDLPINLIAKVRLEKVARQNAVSLPKEAVLADETQTHFWVMKMVDSSTAVKVPVTKGIEMNNRIEILSPVFSSSDQFLLTGNYGLADSARVRIIRE